VKQILGGERRLSYHWEKNNSSPESLTQFRRKRMERVNRLNRRGCQWNSFNGGNDGKKQILRKIKKKSENSPARNLRKNKRAGRNYGRQLWERVRRPVSRKVLIQSKERGGDCTQIVWAVCIRANGGGAFASTSGEY